MADHIRPSVGENELLDPPPIHKRTFHFMRLDPTRLDKDLALFKSLIDHGKPEMAYEIMKDSAEYILKSLRS